ncbi:MAG: hypothetical protein HYY36_04760 [Gammaproteobacteria bacterium]|nr:hypothetical protein [Gammaproteobacteria bacterium]
MDQLGLRPEAKRKLLRDNAIELFRLHESVEKQTPKRRKDVPADAEAPV